MKILADIVDDPLISRDVDICKSGSGTAGYELRAAHYRLGLAVGRQISQDYFEKDYIVIIMLRSGLPFGFGIADYLDCSIILSSSDSTEKILEDCKLEIHTKKVAILCDAVINTGTSIKKMYGELVQIFPKVVIAANVIQNKFNPGNMDIYAVRLSMNTYVGAKVKEQVGDVGPDTGDRLFNTLM